MGQVRKFRIGPFTTFPESNELTCHFRPGRSPPRSKTLAETDPFNPRDLPDHSTVKAFKTMGPPNKKAKLEETTAPRRGVIERKVEARILEFKADKKVASFDDLDLNLLLKFIEKAEPAFKRQKGACKDLFIKEGNDPF